MKTILFPGSFDPFTRGHYSLVERSLAFCDEVVIAVGVNEQKAGWIPAEQRVDALRNLYKRNARVRVESYHGLTTDFAAADEMQMADINRQLTGIETVCLFAEPALAAISSSVVRELAHFGKDISSFLPDGYHILINDENTPLT